MRSRRTPYAAREGERWTMTSRVEIYPPSTKIPGESAAEFLSGLTSRMSHEERLAQVQWLASVMDDRFAVPGTPLRFGWDSILGLFPGLGDVLTSLISLLIVHHAWQTGASRFTLARMVGNVALDFVVGAVPFVGDLFDVAFKANRRNARLLEQHLKRRNNNANYRFRNS
jgi:uncharacterized protein DUF4112